MSQISAIKYAAKLLGLVLFISCLTMISSELKSQVISAPEEVVLKDSGVLEISDSSELKPTYTFKLGVLAQRNSAELVELFGSRMNEDVMLRPLSDRGEGVLILKLKNHPDWTIADWNAYLSEHFSRLPLR